MAKDPAADLVTFLAAQSLGLIAGTNLFPGPVRAQGPGTPYDSVFVISRSGRIPERVMGESFEVRSPLIHVRLRNRKYTVGGLLSTNILDKVLDGSIAGYLDVEPLQSAGEFVQDSEGVMYWGLTFLFKYQQDATP